MFWKESAIPLRRAKESGQNKDDVSLLFSLMVVMCLSVCFVNSTAVATDREYEYSLTFLQSQTRWQLRCITARRRSSRSAGFNYETDNTPVQADTFNTNATSFAFGEPDFLSDMHFLGNWSLLQYFDYIFTAHAQKLLFPGSRLKILTSALDSATRIS